MVMTKEMQEILNYLSTKEDYVLFAGFAAFLYTQVISSADIDIFVYSKEQVEQITEVFVKKNWQILETTDQDDCYVQTLEKNNTTFDICFTESAKEIILPTKTKINFDNLRLNVGSKEALFLTKIFQLIHPRRTKEKMQRDHEVINILRKEVDLDKVKKLILKFKDIAWRESKI